MTIGKKVFPAQPLSIRDAVDVMGMVGPDFYLFVDAETGRPSAVYRRKGWTYGVICLDPEKTDAEPQEEEIGYRTAV